ncbi:hypothetical protein GOODEAATRI_028063 [Goodea atripinnis]|uniref:F-box domain-containing protein n=1 Tax=Goodea atripinnis TaxID=208336 RepID=A0ABV0Q1S6_9TELE
MFRLNRDDSEGSNRMPCLTKDSVVSWHSDGIQRLLLPAASTDNLSIPGSLRRRLETSTRTLSTPSPGLILPSKSSSLSSPALSSNGHETNSSSSSSAHTETVAVIHAQPGVHTRSRQCKAHHQAPINLLPDHSILQIFSHLPTNQLCRCARVCRRWYNLAWDPRLWSTIRLSGELLHADRAIRVLTHRLCQDTPNVCLTLEIVVVNGCKRLTDRGLHILAQCCPELRRLEVAGCYNISNDAVFEVVSRCPNLEHLDLSGKKNKTRGNRNYWVLVILLLYHFWIALYPTFLGTMFYIAPVLGDEINIPIQH